MRNPFDFCINFTFLLLAKKEMETDFEECREKTGSRYILMFEKRPYLLFN